MNEERLFEYDDTRDDDLRADDFDDLHGIERPALSPRWFDHPKPTAYDVPLFDVPDEPQCVDCRHPFRWIAAGDAGTDQTWYRQFETMKSGAVRCADRQACAARKTKGQA